MSMLNLTWAAISFEGNVLEILIKFNSPQSISPNIDQDQLIVDLSTAIFLGFFKSIDGRVMQQQDKTNILSHRIRLQMVNNNFNNNFQHATQVTGSTGTYILWGTIVLNVFMHSAFNQMCQWINSIQLIIHLPMLRILVPPSVTSFFEAIIPVFTFDILSSEWTSELVLTFDKDQ